MYVWKQPAGMHQPMVAFSAAWFELVDKLKISDLRCLKHGSLL